MFRQDEQFSDGWLWFHFHTLMNSPFTILDPRRKFLIWEFSPPDFNAQWGRYWEGGVIITDVRFTKYRGNLFSANLILSPKVQFFFLLGACCFRFFG